MRLATLMAARFTAAERATTMVPLLEAIERLRAGAGTHDDWQQADSALLVAITIEKQGVIKGLSSYWLAAEHAVNAVYYRAFGITPGSPYTSTPQPSAWHPCALHHTEREALADLANMHHEQLKVLSYGEYKKAILAATHQVEARNARLDKALAQQNIARAAIK
jgi:hypothetical protein